MSFSLAMTSALHFHQWKLIATAIELAPALGEVPGLGLVAGLLETIDTDLLTGETHFAQMDLNKPDRRIIG